MNDPYFLGMVLLALTQIGGFVLTMRKVVGISESRRIEPQPLEVKPSPDFMTRADCIRAHEQNARIETQRFDAIERRLEDLTKALERRNQEGESRASRIHGRVDECAREIARIDGTLTTHVAQRGAHNAG